MTCPESSSGATSGEKQPTEPDAGTTPTSIPRTATEWSTLAGRRGLYVGSSTDIVGHDFQSYIESMVVAEWSKALSEFWAFAKGERGNQLTGKYVRRTDGRGIDPISEAWGMVLACERLFPELAEVRVRHGATPASLRKDAQGVAEREYAHKILEGAQSGDQG